MLQTIDVLVGFALVMLVLSAIVTMLVQWIVTTLRNLKGEMLRDSIAHLLCLVDRQGLTNEVAKDIADRILRDPLIGKKKLIGNGNDLADAVHREELVKLLLDFAQPVTSGESQGPQKDASLRAALFNSLKSNGIEEPANILKNVRFAALELEKDRPELSHDARHSLALATHANSEFLAKINAWFDQTIDRTTETFTRRVRIYTVAVACVVGIFFQADTFQLLHRLSADKQTRAALVNLAVTEPHHFASLTSEADTGQQSANTAPPASDSTASTSAPPVTATTPRNADAPADGVKSDARFATKMPPAETANAIQALENIRGNAELNDLVDTNLISWPSDHHNWYQRAINPQGRPHLPNAYAILVHWVGVLLTASLLTLGAPVWYEVLKNLIQLRSVTARKDDAQRATRQTHQARGAPTATQPTPDGSPRKPPPKAKPTPSE